MTSPPTPASPIDRVADAHFARELALSPWRQLDVGRGGQTPELDDYSPTGLAALDEACRTSLAELDRAEAEQRSTTGISEREEVTVHALRERLGIVRELHATGRDLTLFNVIESAPQLLRDLLDILPTASDADWELAAGRMRRFPAALDGFADTARAAVAAGTAPSREQVEAVVAQCRALARAGGHIDRFAARAGTRGTALEREITAAAEARDGYRQLADRLVAEILPSGGEDPACGREAYALHSRFFLGEEIDVDEAYAWALEDLDRIDREQRQLAAEIGLSDSLRGTFEALDRSPAHSRIGHEALIAWMQEAADEAIDALSRAAFDIPEPLRRIECRVQPDGTGVVFYSRPTADFSRPGRMWWSVPAGEEHFGIWRERTTVYHEGAPGHHLQYGIATLMAEELGAWRSQGCWVSGHGEGWALYAEQLMADLGFHADPADSLGMLDAQRLRTARVVIDIGVHCRLTAPEALGGGVWTSAQAKRLLADNVAMSHGSLDFEHLRYMGWPGQAASYRLGERLWTGIRREAEARAGAGFDERSFHRRALETGSVGLSTLRLASQRF